MYHYSKDWNKVTGCDTEIILFWSICESFAAKYSVHVCTTLVKLSPYFPWFWLQDFEILKYKKNFTGFKVFENIFW